MGSFRLFGVLDRYQVYEGFLYPFVSLSGSYSIVWIIWHLSGYFVWPQEPQTYVNYVK